MQTEDKSMLPPHSGARGSRPFNSFDVFSHMLSAMQTLADNTQSLACVTPYFLLTLSHRRRHLTCLRRSSPEGKNIFPALIPLECRLDGLTRRYARKQLYDPFLLTHFFVLRVIVAYRVWCGCGMHLSGQMGGRQIQSCSIVLLA